jgi:hypothetical protein
VKRLPSGLRSGINVRSKRRKPEGERPLTSAERQGRHRARQHQPSAASRVRPEIDRRSRLQRWRDAAAELLALQAGYAGWLEALPDTLRDTATAEALLRCRGVTRRRTAQRAREHAPLGERVGEATLTNGRACVNSKRPHFRDRGSGRGESQA